MRGIKLLKRAGVRDVLAGAVLAAWYAWTLLGTGLPLELQAAEPTVAASTQAMAERLQAIAKTVNPLNVRFASSGQVDVMQAMLAQQPELAKDLGFRYRMGDALLNAGRNEEALKEFLALELISKTAGGAGAGESPNQNLVNLKLNIALCYLRESERINCLSNHNADSCLMPLQGGGIHRWQDGARKAVVVLTDLLNQFPDDLSARWLLNFSYMALGEYPQKVPQPWRIDPKVFASDIPFPRFMEVGSVVGLGGNELSGGCVVDDFDGDGLLDVMVTSIGFNDPMRLYRNEGNGRFVERTREAGLTGMVGGLNLVSADYDNDGDLDVLVLRGAWMKEEGKFPNSLLRNRGDGTFEDVTEAAGVLSFHPTQAAVWFDFDGDGWLDLFIGNESLRVGPRHLCELYRNQGDGTFREFSRLSGVAVRDFVKGVVAGDFNNDGRPDLYLSVLGGANRLFRNDGPKDAAKGVEGGWNFTDVAATAGVTQPMDSFPCWFFDYDNDGWEDIFVAGYKINNVGDIAADYLGLPTGGTKARLYHNQGNGTFADVTAAAKLDRVLHAMGSNFGDLDNDGWLDFYLGTGDPDLLTIIPNRMFRNAEGKLFQDVTTAGGFGLLQKGHAVAFADLDNDGDQDVIEDMGGAVTGDVYPNVVFENPGFGNHWLKLKFQGVRSNRGAVGARVEVTVEEKGKARTLYRTVGTGGSFGANPHRVELGLGKADRLVSVKVTWPGSTQRVLVGGIEMDRAYGVKEGDEKAVETPLKQFRFPPPQNQPHLMDAHGH